METIKRLLKSKQAKIGLAAAVVVVVLAAVFFLQPAPNQSQPVAGSSDTLASASGEPTSLVSSGVQGEGPDNSAGAAEDGASGNAAPTTPNESSGGAAASASPTSSQTAGGQDTEASDDSGNAVDSSAGTASSASGMEIDPATGKDSYQTDPVPEGKPVPVEPAEVTVDESKELTCTLSIRCDTILNNMNLLKEEKKALIPSGGVILETTTVTFSEGESVFDVLKRITREQRIHMEFSMTPIYNSAYIEGIHNLYQFDCGNLSGWMYKVNNWFPNYGCSRYQLKQGDVIEWVYTCDNGRDVGGEYAAAGQGVANE